MDANDKSSMLAVMDHMIYKLFCRSNGLIKCDLTATACKQGEHVEFLDLKIGIGYDQNKLRNKFITTSLFDKPTNLHIYTDPSTFYPFHYIYNWIQGENIRLIRNSSTQEDYHKCLSDFTHFLSRRGYHNDLINRFVRKNYYEDRVALLNLKKPHKQREPKDRETKNVLQIQVRNSGSRPMMTHNIKLLNNFASTCSDVDLRLQPIVLKGKSVLSVFDLAKKNLTD